MCVRERARELESKGVSVRKRIKGVSESAYLNIITIKSSVGALHYSGTVLVTAGSASNTL